MSKFAVTVQTASQRIRYTAIASSSADVAEAAFDKFGLCSVVVRLA